MRVGFIRTFELDNEVLWFFAVPAGSLVYFSSLVLLDREYDVASYVVGRVPVLFFFAWLKKRGRMAVPVFQTCSSALETVLYAHKHAWIGRKRPVPSLAPEVTWTGAGVPSLVGLSWGRGSALCGCCGLCLF